MAEDGGNWEAHIIHYEPYTYIMQGLRSVLANEKDRWREGSGINYSSKEDHNEIGLYSSTKRGESSTIQ